MHAIRIEQFGGPDALRLMPTDTAQAQAGQALVEVRMAGVNFIDIYMRNGSYARSQTYRTPLPMTIGMEAVG
ncbi:MAG TPA: quinone oxidoreductase, partial [Burkholderiaceae bacterium]|nr:quinone oxidoreductase [Burkholderiaceae bacterium]